MDLFRFSIFSCFSLSVYVSRNLSISSRLLNLLAYSCSYCSLIIVCISAVLVVLALLSSIILFIWVLSLFFLISLARGLSVLLILSKNQFLILSICSSGFFISKSLISALILIISPFLLDLGFIWCCLSRSFRCIVMLCIWDFSYISRKAFIAIYFPQRTTFSASQRFWTGMFSFSFACKYFF